MRESECRSSGEPNAGPKAVADNELVARIHDDHAVCGYAKSDNVTCC